MGGIILGAESLGAVVSLPEVLVLATMIGVGTEDWPLAMRIIGVGSEDWWNRCCQAQAIEDYVPTSIAASALIRHLSHTL